MNKNIKIEDVTPNAELLAEALRRVMDPIAHMFLKRGFSWGEFEEIAKLAYVGQAAEHFQIPNRKMTDSRIAIITGLTRRDVKRLRELNEAGEHSSKAYNANRATRVLSGWCQDQAYLDNNGNPIDLPIDLPVEANTETPSFAQLARVYAGDVPVMALVQELKRSGAIKQHPDGTLSLESRSYTPNQDNIEQLNVVARAISDLVSTVDHNTTAHDESDRWFQRSAFNNELNAASVAKLHEFLDQEGQAFLERLDDWMNTQVTEQNASDAPPHKGSSEASRVGVGMYFFERD